MCISLIVWYKFHFSFTCIDSLFLSQIPCTHLTMDDAKKMNADEKAGLLRLAEMN